MAFKIYQTDDGRAPAIEYLAAGAITPKAGMLLCMTSGKLAVAGGANAPVYLSTTESATALTAGTVIPVIRLAPDMILETIADGAGTGTVGAFYDVATGGLKLDSDASTYDNLELVWTENTTLAAGTKCRVRVVK